MKAAISLLLLLQACGTPRGDPNSDMEPPTMTAHPEEREAGQEAAAPSQGGMSVDNMGPLAGITVAPGTKRITLSDGGEEQ